jgi:hypothetical protein
MASKSINRGENPAAKNDKGLAKEVAKQNDEVRGSLSYQDVLAGPGATQDVVDYIMGKEPHGQFPLGWIPTDREAVRGALLGAGPGELVDKGMGKNEKDSKDNGKQGY